jgi:drug/metabolite transporter (DMT)-like permease
MQEANLPIGELSALASAAFWAIASILWTRQMAVSRPIAMNLFKTGFCLPLFLLVVVARGGWGGITGIDAGSVVILLISGVVGMSIGDTFYFAGLERIGARRTMMIQTTSPIFAAVLSFFAGQPLPGIIASVGVVAVLAGLLLVLRERPVGLIVTGKLRSGIALAFGASFSQALGIVLTKEGLARVDILEASTIRIVGGVLGILLIEALRRRLIETVGQALKPPALSRIIPATLMGTFFGFLLFQAAVEYAEPAVAATLLGTSPLFVAPLSVLLLGEAMRAGGWLGTALAVAGAIIVILA